MTGKSVLITGCSSGIGLGVAEGLKDKGYRVFASARKVADVTRLTAAGFESLQLDLADSTSIRAAVDNILVRTDGSLDALFNNGAYGQPGAVEDLSREVLRAQFETNLFGWHELTNRVIPVMRRQGHGRIIQNSSVLGFVALRFRGAYNASKFALEGLTDTLRLELAGTGIHVSLIEPGPIASRFRENAFKAYQRNINPDNSVHREMYRRMEARLTKQGPAVPFTLPAEAVLGKVVHALESRHPKARYYVTFPTYLFAFLKRILTDRALDRVLNKVG
jgi:NAD(P)-dependent dehydrogenase (short-subunit alcohol dehydrogenase family)